MMCTGIKAGATINWGKPDNTYLDNHLWRYHDGVSVGFDKYIAVGIKHGRGLCGGGGHVKDWKKWNGQDKDYKLLESIVDKESLDFL